MPPYLISLVASWLEARQVSKRTRRLIGLTAALVLLVSVLPYFLHFGSGPAWLGELAADWAAEQGLEMRMDSVRLRGWGEAIVEGIEVDSGLEEHGVERVAAERAILRFDWFPALRGEVPRVRGILLDGPEIEVRLSASEEAPDRPDEGAPQPETSAADAGTEGARKGDVGLALQGPIAFEVRDGRIELREGPAELGADVSFRGMLHADTLEIEMLRVAVDGTLVEGRLEADGKITWAEGDVQANGELHGESIALFAGEDVYSVERLEGSVTFADGQWSLPELLLHHAGGRVELVGGGDASGVYAFDVAASRLDLAASLPVLERLGFAGEGAFTGSLTGRGLDVVLHGEATFGPGRIWGRQHETASGVITLTPEEIHFHHVLIHQAVGWYDLEGSYEFPNEAPGRLQLAVAAQGGQVSDLLAVLGAEELPITGRLSGYLQFAGPLGAVRGDGTIEALEVFAWEQPFDRVVADFSWQGERLHITSAEAGLGAGTLHLAGELALDGGDMQLHFDATDWSLGDIEAMAAWSDALGGRIDVRDGQLIGSISEPELTAEMASDGLRIGSTVFHGVEGGLHMSGDALEVRQLTGWRSGGGEYRIMGSVQRSETGELETESTIAVADEDLRELLRLAGQELPALLVDGSVAGEITVSGAVERPDARLDLTWSRADGTSPGVELALRWVDGQVDVERFGRTAASLAS